MLAHRRFQTIREPSNFCIAADATGTVTYTFKAVPEPSAFVLMGLGIAGMVEIARRKRV